MLLSALRDVRERIFRRRSAVSEQSLLPPPDLPPSSRTQSFGGKSRPLSIRRHHECMRGADEGEARERLDLWRESIGQTKQTESRPTSTSPPGPKGTSPQ